METRLRSWTPRRPSAKLKARLFSGSTAGAPVRAPSWNWLAPATGCLLLLFVTFGRHGQGLNSLAGTGESPVIALTLSNQSLAAYLPGSFPYEQNAVPADTFEWTNTSRSTSSIPSFSRSGTNELRR